MYVFLPFKPFNSMHFASITSQLYCWENKISCSLLYSPSFLPLICGCESLSFHHYIPNVCICYAINLAYYYWGRRGERGIILYFLSFHVPFPHFYQAVRVIRLGELFFVCLAFLTGFTFTTWIKSSMSLGEIGEKIFPC